MLKVKRNQRAASVSNRATKKSRFHGVNHRNGVEVLPTGTEQHEEQGENVALIRSGPPGGATWSEIRSLISRCEDLPEDARGHLVAMGDKSQVGSVELSSQ